MTWQVGWWVKGWAPTGLVRTSHSPAPYSGVSGSGYALIILELPKDNSHDITVGSFLLCHFFSFLWCNMCCTGHNSMLVFILFQKKINFGIQTRPVMTGADATVLYNVYNGVFLTRTVHTYYISGPETRHIPLHLLRRDRLGFCAPTQIIFWDSGSVKISKLVYRRPAAIIDLVQGPNNTHANRSRKVCISFMQTIFFRHRWRGFPLFPELLLYTNNIYPACLWTKQRCRIRTRVSPNFASKRNWSET